jgi:hypothetical protein
MPNREIEEKTDLSTCCFWGAEGEVAAARGAAGSPLSGTTCIAGNSLREEEAGKS